MKRLINGLHHITTLAGDAQKNIDFYTGILGLRFVKKTVNFDAPEVYHLYYGDQKGNPGTVFTTFPFGNIRQGAKGTGEVSTTAFSIPATAVSYWIDRLKKFDIEVKDIIQRFGEEVIQFSDHDGLSLELIANDQDTRKGWQTGHIPGENAIRGFYGVTLHLGSYERTLGLLTEIMEHRLIEEKNNRFRLEAGDGGPGTYMEILWDPAARPAMQGNGSVHHVAFSTDADETQLEIREKLLAAGHYVTEVKDRQYFHSIYFREPAGVLFEVATNPPGFTLDEPEEKLGEALKLPPWEEKNRNTIEKGLAPVQYKVYK